MAAVRLAVLMLSRHEGLGIPPRCNWPFRQSDCPWRVPGRPLDRRSAQSPKVASRCEVPWRRPDERITSDKATNTPEVAAALTGTTIRSTARGTPSDAPARSVVRSRGRFPSSRTTSVTKVRLQSSNISDPGDRRRVIVRWSSGPTSPSKGVSQCSSGSTGQGQHLLARSVIRPAGP